MYISHRSDVAAFVVMDVMQAAADLESQGHKVLHMEIGQPGTPAPAAVLNVAKEALDTDKLGYTVALGIPELRQAISQHYADRYELDVDPQCVVVTPGSSGGFIVSFLTCFDKGDRVAVPAPGYPCYRNILKSLDLEAVDVEISPDNNYLLMPADLEKLDPPVKGVIVSSPGNPTGSMYSEQQLKELVEYCQANDIAFISDEIYHGISFGKPAVSALQFSNNLFVVNSFSKYFTMTGWRIGWLVVPKEMVRPIERLIQNLLISTTTLSQLGAVEAFKCYDEFDGYVEQYKAKRDLLYKRLTEAGLNKISSPDGAFYLYADISHLTDDSVAFCQRILNEIHVAVTPGVDFDPVRGKQTMRFSYAADMDTIDEASKRLKKWFLAL
ncbi:MAG: pyridoxal phosphate-dependent aminotransferase [Psychrosphaera sp.]|nr:pyridoxal phosphate-dependent aminotransferase [Psychrosphaera sp.]